MGLVSDIRVLYHLALSPIKGNTHAERLESFYAGQAGAYDDFRKRLLRGREELFDALQMPEDGVWVDLGGGTGSNAEVLGDKLEALSKGYIVDLSPSLLKVASERLASHGWGHIAAVEADATTFRPEEGTASVVTCSYSLTMIPDWFAAIDNAYDMLKPGGTFAAVDFYIARKYEEAPDKKQGRFTRTFWPLWFYNDNVFLSSDHVPYLQRKFKTTHLSMHWASVPYMPGLKAPYYRFTGTKG